MNPFSTPKSAHQGFTYKKPSIPVSSFSVRQSPSFTGLKKCPQLDPVFSQAEEKENLTGLLPAEDHHSSKEMSSSIPMIAYNQKSSYSNPSDVSPSEGHSTENCMTTPSGSRKRGSPFTLPRTPFPLPNRLQHIIEENPVSIRSTLAATNRMLSKDIQVGKCSSPYSTKFISEPIMKQSEPIFRPSEPTIQHESVVDKDTIRVNGDNIIVTRKDDFLVEERENISEKVTAARLEMVSRKLNRYLFLEIFIL